MHRYAAIGTRYPSEAQHALCCKIGRYMAGDDWILHTGACTGCDQAYVEGALENGGRVRLHSPWWSYERAYIDSTLHDYPKNVRVTVLSDDDQDAFDSVRDFHPSWDYFVRENKGGAIRLHARNWNILWQPKRVDFVVALPSPKGGGTMQGVRIATAHNIPILRLDRLPENEVFGALTALIRSCTV